MGWMGKRVVCPHVQASVRCSCVVSWVESLIFCLHLLPVAAEQEGSKIVDGVHVCVPVSAQSPCAVYAKVPN